MEKYKEHQTFELSKDLNEVIRKGMIGVLLVIYNQNAFEVEFVKKDGTNYEFNGNSTFTIDNSYILKLLH